ncbi:MAG: hypothetical protein GY936_13065 [Ignavibacteriae bacterium]|nr:hypothetical protein [Ignavibacteriota bacterium]
MKKILAGLLFITFSILFGQNNNNVRVGAPNVFVDCERCDTDFIRDEVTFVNYVWDRNNADIHILFSHLRTGGGGEKYTISFIGGDKFVGINDTLNYVHDESDSDDDARKKMVQTIKLGLIKYVARMPIASNVKITFDSPKENETKLVKDEWDYWVFRTRLSGYTNGEESSSYLNVFGSFSANRITEDWKLKISLRGSYNESSFDYDGSSILSISRYHGFAGSIVKSQSDHLSLGLFSHIHSSIYRNMELSLSFAPGIEYNIYPYSESSSRQLRIAYKTYIGHNNYNEETIYLKNEEMLWSEKLSITLELVQPWGSIESEVSGAHYFHDFSLNSIRFSNEFRIKVTKQGFNY